MSNWLNYLNLKTKSISIPIENKKQYHLFNIIFFKSINPFVIPFVAAFRAFSIRTP